MKMQKEKRLLKKYAIRTGVICFWFLFWEIMNRIIDNKILLSSPFSVIKTLFELILKIDFWQTIYFSFIRIVIGFLFAVAVGITLAVFSYWNVILRELIMPFMKVLKSIPVASFIILALVWINSKNLSILISFLMVVPIIYINVAQGLSSADPKLLEMAQVFGLGRIKKAYAIYIPAAIPHFISAVSVGLGFCWKSGIAAEVIGQTYGSIGGRLYEAKLFLMTNELFAWTIVIVIISILFEKSIMWMIQLIQHRS